MYNTRRGGAPASNVGQRRPPQQQMNRGFVSGGQLRPNTPQNQGYRTAGGPPNNHQQQVQRTPVKPQAPEPPKVEQQETKILFKSETEPKAAVKVEPVQQQPTKAESAPEPVPAPTPVATSTPAPAPTPVPTPAPAKETAAAGESKEDAPATTEENNGLDTSTDGDGTTEKVRPPWMKKKPKVPKAELNRIRNKRLKKMLQPKNALMVLNELVGNTTYDLAEVNMTGQVHFRASCIVDGQMLTGTGKNKVAAKNAAAESAIKHVVMSKMVRPPMPSADTNASISGDTTIEDEDDVKMEMQQEQTKDDEISYRHLASFALYKLLGAWDIDSGLISNTTPTAMDTSPQKETEGTVGQMRPSRKLPENPHLMNPVMLLNQMYPNAVYEDVCKTGIPPKIVFTVKCTLESQSFIGNGPNKKTARRDAAYQACREILGITYEEDTKEEEMEAQ